MWLDLAGLDYLCWVVLAIRSIGCVHCIGNIYRDRKFCSGREEISN